MFAPLSFRSTAPCPCALPGTYYITHGYLYDAEKGEATWLSDTWAWERNAWKRVVSDKVPSARDSHTSVLYQKGAGSPTQMIMFGGNDGGMAGSTSDKTSEAFGFFK